MNRISNHIDISRIHFPIQKAANIIKSLLRYDFSPELTEGIPPILNICKCSSNPAPLIKEFHTVNLTISDNGFSLFHVLTKNKYIKRRILLIL